ncbi:MAG: ComEC/Rec2 family competence protein, partial [Chloroflexota bacterium]
MTSPKAFTTTGLNHVVAISGWNIALIGAVVGGLLSAVGLDRRPRTMVIVAALGAFTLLAGGGASVVRAALMGGGARRPRDGPSRDRGCRAGPRDLGPAAARPGHGRRHRLPVVGRGDGGPARVGRSSHRPDGGVVPGAAATMARRVAGRLARGAGGDPPLVLFHFGRLSLVSPLANLVVAPVVAPAMLVAPSASSRAWSWASGRQRSSRPRSHCSAGWCWVRWSRSRGLRGPPFASIDLAPKRPRSARWASRPSSGRWPGMPAGTDRAGPPTGRPDPRGTARRRRCISSWAWVSQPPWCWARGSWSGHASRASARGHALDVGQGDSILVEGPVADGSCSMGADPDRLLTVLDRHVPPWDRRIDLVILTHPHEDHVAGLAMLLARYRVAGVAENGMLGAGPGDAAFRERLRSSGVVTSRLAAGDRLTFDGIRVDVRWPVRGEVPARAPSEGRRVNDTSVVLDLRFGERRFLLTGDIEDDVDPRLLSTGIGDDRRLDVLKVAHHGSRTATSDAWLDALRPRVAMVSAGTGNPYGHPAPRTIERLLAHDARVLRTDLDGDLEVSTDGHDLRVATSGGR